MHWLNDRLMENVVQSLNDNSYGGFLTDTSDAKRMMCGAIVLFRYPMKTNRWLSMFVIIYYQSILNY